MGLPNLQASCHWCSRSWASCRASTGWACGEHGQQARGWGAAVHLWAVPGHTALQQALRTAGCNGGPAWWRCRRPSTACHQPHHRSLLNTNIEHEYAGALSLLSLWYDGGADDQGADQFVTGGGQGRGVEVAHVARTTWHASTLSCAAPFPFFLQATKSWQSRSCGGRGARWTCGWATRQGRGGTPAPCAVCWSAAVSVEGPPPLTPCQRTVVTAAAAAAAIRDGETHGASPHLLCAGHRH